MTLIDIILAIPMIWLMVHGWRRGVVGEVAILAGVLLGIWAAVHLSQWVTEQFGLEGENAVLIAFFICFVGGLVAAYFIGKAVANLMKMAHIGTVNRIGGAFFGLLKALCVLAVLINFVQMIDKHEVIIKPETKAKSVLYNPVFNTGNWLTASLKEYIAQHRDEWQNIYSKQDDDC